MLELFHYTDKKGLEGIIRDGNIHSSEGKFGYGVYLTTIPPDQPRKDTAGVIFGRGGTARFYQGRLDHYVRIKIHSWEDGLAFRKVGSREHRLWRKYDLHLSRYEWDCGTNDSWSSSRSRKSVPAGLLISLEGSSATAKSYSRLVDLTNNAAVRPMRPNTKE